MRYITCILILFAVCSCKKANDDTTKLIVVDVAKDYPQKEIYLQDIADVEYIPLTTSDSILVNSSPSIVSDKGIVTRGGKVGEILLFDAKGQELRFIVSQTLSSFHPSLRVLHTSWKPADPIISE
jgi:hypothetical protein